MKKIQWLDTLKGIAIILVVLGHSSPDVSLPGGPSDQYFKILYNVIYSFHMPLMFWIAGFLSLSVLDYSNSDNVQPGGGR